MSIVVIGASNRDVTLRLKEALHPQASNPVVKHTQWGGVGRNLAEALGRLGLPVTLVTPFALTDEPALKASLPPLPLHRLDVDATPEYLEVLDTQGDLTYGFAAMDALNQLQPHDIKPHASLIAQATVVVLDANLPTSVLEALPALTQGLRVADGTSALKVTRLKTLLKSLHLLKLNHHEAAVLSGLSDPLEQLPYFHMQGVQHTVITTPEGVYTHDPTPRFVPHPYTVPVLSTTGAGDAFLAGLIYAMHHQEDPLSCAFACARLALQASTPIPLTLTPERLRLERKKDHVKHS